MGGQDPDVVLLDPVEILFAPVVSVPASVVRRQAHDVVLEEDDRRELAHDVVLLASVGIR